jgi:hypothetical protein
MTIGSAVPGAVTVTMTGSANQFTVQATGSRTGTIGSQSRTLTATLNLGRSFVINQALASNSNLTIPKGFVITSGLTGVPAIATTGTVTLQTASVVTGTVSASSVNNQSLPATTQPAPTSSIVPTLQQVNHYATYTYNGTSYNATAITASSLSGTTLGPTASNPMGVYLATGNLTLGGGVTVNGTLVVQNGTLKVTGLLNKVTAQSGYPALVVDQTLMMSGIGTTMTANGVVWLGQGMAPDTHNTTLSAVFTVNGALLTDSGGFTESSGLVPYTALVTYSATAASAAGLTSQVGTPQQVSVVSWTPG